MRTIQQIQEDVHSTVRSKGFWNQEQLIDKASIEDAQEIRDLIIAQKLALIHSEVSEALEACRAGKRADVESYKVATGITLDDVQEDIAVQSRAYKDYIKDSLEGELAGTVIRVMDLCGWLGIDLGWFIEQELEYNKSRPTKHGKKY